MTLTLYCLALLLLAVSYAKDRENTKKSVIKAWNAFAGILPQILVILLVIGLTLALISPEKIDLLFGRQSGWFGVLAAALLGAITLIPGFVAFPLAAALYRHGGGVVQIAVFVCTLMAVGVLTLPLEIEHFGVRASLLRNGLAFLFSFGVAFAMGGILQ